MTPTSTLLSQGPWFESATFGQCSHCRVFTLPRVHTATCSVPNYTSVTGMGLTRLRTLHAGLARALDPSHLQSTIGTRVCLVSIPLASLDHLALLRSLGDIAGKSGTRIWGDKRLRLAWPMATLFMVSNVLKPSCLNVALLSDSRENVSVGWRLRCSAHVHQYAHVSQWARISKSGPWNGILIG